MKAMSSILFVLGWILIVGGLSIEVVAMAAMGSYPIRRALPFPSPTSLLSIGCYIFLGGCLLLGIAAIVG